MKTTRKMTRREMLATLGKAMGAGVCASALPGLALPASAKEKRIGLALQLYSVRKHCGQDFDGTLEKVAAMGYEAVEFAGYYKYGNNAVGLRKKLDSLGLKVAGSHIRSSDLRPHKIGGLIKYHKAIGNRYLIVPGDGRISDPKRYKEFAEFMMQAAAGLKPHGMLTGYHNHTKEFKKVDGKTFWEHFGDSTPKEVVLQQDVGWTTHAGLDPVPLIRKYPGRTKTAHFKPTVKRGDGGKEPIIGRDSVDWKAVIEACYGVGGTEWFIVEQERYLPGKSPLECSDLSLKGLKTVLKGMGKA
ncbi:MAG: sugar phosphate isomerase/epimerase family protein [Planctomycetota bacterium]|jgi:sugar phosphate isomerase/epimerase